VIGAADILHAPMMMASLARLGYPVYLRDHSRRLEAARRRGDHPAETF